MNTQKNLWLAFATVVLFAGIVSAQQEYVFQQIAALHFQDMTEIASPGPPANFDERWYADSATHLMTCIRHDGTSCGSTTPPGLINPTLLSACPAGFSQVTTLDGKMPVGTIAAHANVGTTGGSDSVTPSGTVDSPVFTGDEMPTHQHQLPFEVDQDNLAVGFIKTGNYGVGTDAQGSILQFNNDGVTSPQQMVSLTDAVTAGTPTGSVSAPNFSGAAFDNRSAFVRVIYCSRN